MKKAFLIFLLIFFTNCFAQTNALNAIQLDSISFNASSFVGTDGFGYYYYIKNNVFIKSKKNENFEYKNLALGQIQHVDIQNPLMIVLFYENFNTIITLDNQLNESNKLNFSDFKTPLLVTATGMASQNRFWIYDQLTQKIGLFDYISNNYVALTQSFDGVIKFYNSDFNTFHWIDDKLNWFSCDVFGKITSFGKVENFDKMQIINHDTFLFSVGNQLFLKNYASNQKYAIKIVDKSFESFFYKDQILSIFTIEGITNYKIKIP